MCGEDEVTDRLCVCVGGGWVQWRVIQGCT